MNICYNQEPHQRMHVEVTQRSHLKKWDWGIVGVHFLDLLVVVL